MMTSEKPAPCVILVKDGRRAEICKVTISLRNGNGAEGEESLMEATDTTKYDTSELEDLQDELFSAIEELNPYPKKLNALAYESKGCEQFVANFPCEQCGNFGVSINEIFMKIGRCYYCGYEHEMVRCERGGDLVSEGVLEYGFCPSCAVYIDKQ